MTGIGAREFDVVLYGATGYVGRLVAAHIAEHSPAGLSVALAGRSMDRMAETAARIGGPAPSWPTMFADTAHAGSLNEMARRSRVVVSMVGPYYPRGLALVGACAHHGTHYTDLTGELLFVRESIDCFDEMARDSGAKIVHSCGFDAVPSDLAVHLAACQARIDRAGDLEEVTGYFSMRGGVSGGTIASMMGQLDAARTDTTAKHLLLDPYALSPDRTAEPDGGHSRYRSRSVSFDERVNRWTAPFVMSSFNEPTVRRSNALLGWEYGRNLEYGEALVVGFGQTAHLQAHLADAIVPFVSVMAATPPSRAVLQRFLPKPGEGPDDASRARGFFRLTTHAVTSRGAHYIAKVAARQDPGYGATAVMIGQSALSLAQDGTKLPERAGVLTPATALGDCLVDRLWDHGFTAAVEHA